MQTYIEVTFDIVPFNEEFSDILIAELGDIGYDNFVKTENGLKAYIKKEKFDIAGIKAIYFLQNNPSISVNTREIIEENWNEKWEQSYDYIELENCIVVAPFHKNYPKKKYEIIISPKMSFGTGHHATTYLMLDFIIQHNVAGNNILDMGCGTGVLAILASMKGAKKILAIDIDEWAYENTIENVSLNHINNIEVLKGNKTLLGNQNFDTIFANINRNILLEDIPAYSSVLNTKGHLFLSGFYTTDIDAIEKKCAENDLHLKEKKERNNWCALSFTKV